MNHPYMFPDEAPWTDEYADLQHVRRVRYINTVTGEERYDLEDDRDGLIFWHV